MSKSRVIGVILALLGVVLFSAKAVIVKMAYQYPVDAVSLLLLRMLFALPMYLVVAVVKRPKDQAAMTKGVYLWIIGLGIVGYYLASLFDFLGLVYIKASLERIILFVYPTIVLFISRVFFKKQITRRQLIAIVLTYLGIVLAFVLELRLDGEGLMMGVGLIFLSAVTYASYIAGSGWLIPKIGATVFTSYAMIISCLCVIIHYLLVGDFNITNYPTEVYVLGFVMAVFSTVIPSYLVSLSIKMIGASSFAIVASFGPISTILLANYFLGESIHYLQWVGTILVMIGVFFVTKKD
ncbi:DMT family transporter [Reichenbachiella carrageenanivorans]|uniref:DMT family transporter n=1 Tax=Reichenbachiella carrageenanivorans TaxID=2979869 RepID=A0ABY6D3A9_9BACT|nr:DMT family transporter [Reichenbachiella carrageenanivorans]UXX78320.1 DMT family transporter [Reichenbachiella carrageenanivorans]